MIFLNLQLTELPVFEDKTVLFIQAKMHSIRLPISLELERIHYYTISIAPQSFHQNKVISFRHIWTQDMTQNEKNEIAS